MFRPIASRAVRNQGSIRRSHKRCSTALSAVPAAVPTPNASQTWSKFRNFTSESHKKGITRAAGHSMIPRKAAVALTETTRTFFKALLDTKVKEDENVAGIILNYEQSSSGEPRMVFSFDFVEKSKLGMDDEGVSLEIMEDGSPKPPNLSWSDGQPKLYIHHNAFMKVLGSTIDVDEDTLELSLQDRDGNVMDPNA